MNHDVLQQIRDHLRAIESLLDGLDGDDSPPPANVTALRPPTVEMEGVIGRPETREVKGRVLWTAGLGIKNDTTTRWVALIARDEVALDASTIVKGQIVRVVGSTKTHQFVNGNGVLTTREELTISSIAPVLDTLAGFVANQ